MKKAGLLLSGLLTLSAASMAQMTIEKRYDVTYSTGSAYDTLGSGSTQLPFPIDWDDDDSDPINLPFEFKYQNTIVSDVSVFTDGAFTFNGLSVESIAALSMDYESKGRGTVHHHTTGAAGDRIFKIEFRNVGRVADTIGNDSLNFQVWLYESDNAMEVRAGYSNVHDSIFATNLMEVAVDGKEVLMTGLIANEGNFISENDDSIGIHSVRFNPLGALEDTIFTMEHIADDPFVLEYMMMGKFPPQGSVIRFMPKDIDTGTGVVNIDFNLAKIFPNPSKDGKYTVELKEQIANAHLSVFDMTGKKVHQTSINGDRLILDLSHLSAGQYFGQIKGLNKTGMFKLIKE